jgi:hypothetical protein
VPELFPCEPRFETALEGSWGIFPSSILSPLLLSLDETRTRFTALFVDSRVFPEEGGLDDIRDFEVSVSLSLVR